MLPTAVLIEIICFIFAIIYLQRKRTGWYWYFVPFMFFIIVVEGTGYIMAAFFRMNNHWIYNIEMLGEILFIPWVFRQIFKEAEAKENIIIITGFIVLVISFTIETIKNNLFIYNSFTYLVMSAVFIIYAGTYFYSLLKKSDPVELAKLVPLWIVAGIFIFYFAGTGVNVFFKQVMQINIAQGIPLRLIIFTVLNAILYGCWSYAFRCRHLQTISSSR